MTLAGGPAAKLGNRFEKLWTLSELVRMLRGETDSLRIEVPGLDSAEFIVQSGLQQEFHQVKRSHQSGKWSIATLASTGIVKTIGELLRNNTHRFVFVSGSSAPELKDLAEAATSAESLDEFARDFLAAAKTRDESHQRVLGLWNCQDLDAWNMLRRVDVRTINDSELERTVTWGLEGLFVDAAGAKDKLSAIVDDAVHRTIGRDELMHELHEAGYALRQIPGNARHAVLQATDRYLAGARRNLIQDSIIPRYAAAEVLARLTGDVPSDCVLTGRAGMGKTACVVAIVEELRQAGAHVLAFRLDRHMAATSTADLGRRLDLEESPTLVLGAATNADRKPAVLIVDQLDAVSAMSGRSSEALEIIERLLREAKPAKIRTLIVCRSFDFQHDPHLRALVGDEHQKTDLRELSIDDVHKVLFAEQFRPEAFGARQLHLLRLPQNLSLFLNSGVSKSATPSFGTTKDLFDNYWEFKRRRVEMRTQSMGEQWMDVITTVCKEMTQTQQLSIRKEKLDQFSPDYLRQFVSEDVFTKEASTYGFGHESFFDYCFARIFIKEQNTLASVLKSAEQHLFRRAQVRQVLAYLRDEDLQRYIREMRDLVLDADVRAHIKDLVFALLADVDDPKDEEWHLWMDWVRPALDAIGCDLANDDDLARRAWERLLGSRSWFKEFDDRGVIEDWLATGNSSQADVAVNYLQWQQPYWPDQVASLLEPYADRDGDWPDRFRTVMATPHLHAGRRLFDLFLKLVDNGTFDDHDGPWAIFWHLVEQQPGWVAEVLAHQLRRQAARSQAASVEERSGGAAWRRDVGSDGGASEPLKTAAETDPKTFVKHVLPAVLQTSEAALKGDEAAPARDAVWPRLIKSATPMLEDACLEALADALAALACRGEELQDEIACLSSCRTYAANHLLLALFRGGATRYANEAVLAFCNQPWRFDCGYVDSPYWSATETIAATTPHCETANRTKLESAVLAYVDPYEQTKEGVQQRGWAMFNLLAAIPNGLRSARAAHRFNELERKFGEPAPAPTGVVVEWVGSPVPKEATEKMDDDQWLSAIAAYPSSDGWPSGDAVQLARRFEQCATEEPERFANIGLRLPSTTNPVYFSELLRSLASPSIATDIKVRVSQRVFGYAKDDCARDIVDLLATASVPLPDDAVKILIALATEPHDADEEAWRQLASSNQPYYNGEIHTNGINTTRGRAVEAMAQLIRTDASYIQRFDPVLDELAKDPRPAVASCVAMMLRMVAYHDAVRGLSLFQRMDFSEERLLATRHVYEFMRENMRHGFAGLESAISRALRSAHPDTRQVGAGLSCLAALHHDDARHLADEAKHGDSYQRRGVAQVASANIGDKAYREWCENTLKIMFSDPDAEVRKCAASCFRRIEKDRVDSHGDLIKAFCASSAFEQDPFFLLHVLKRARSQLPGTVCLVCESFLDRLSSQARDIRERGNGYTVVDLVFRLYQHHQNDQWTSRALDLIDRACLELDSAAKGFEDFER